MKGKIEPAELKEARLVLKAAFQEYPHMIPGHNQREWELWVVKLMRTLPAERVDMKLRALLAKRTTRRVLRKKSDERKEQVERVLTALKRMGEQS